MQTLRSGARERDATPVRGLLDAMCEVLLERMRSRTSGTMKLAFAVFGC